jgi:hypothetical protein
MNPYADRRVRVYVRSFLDNYFSDNEPRTLVLGINPGRFGAGITGVTFTDPVALADECGVPNELPRRRELSSIFVYDAIHRYGTVRAFYKAFFLSALSPLGFTRDGKNLNYYDTPELRRLVTPFIVGTLRKQIAQGCRTDCAIVLGLGENRRFLEELNDRHSFFDRIEPLEHPRSIMQYKRRQLESYLSRYQQVFKNCRPARSTTRQSPSLPNEQFPGRG